MISNASPTTKLLASTRTLKAVNPLLNSLLLKPQLQKGIQDNLLLTTPKS